MRRQADECTAASSREPMQRLERPFDALRDFRDAAKCHGLMIFRQSARLLRHWLMALPLPSFFCTISPPYAHCLAARITPTLPCVRRFSQRADDEA